MSVIDSVLEDLVLSRGAPFAQVDVSGCGRGTVEESNAAGGLTRGGLSAPFRATGICQADEYVGACIQEVWEGAWQQWALIVLGIPVVVLIAALAFAVGHFSGVPLLGLALGGVGALVLAVKLPSFQTAQSEITSHEISWLAQQRYEGATEERADQCFVANLSGYDYGAFHGKADADFKAWMATKRTYALAWLARPDVAALCLQLARGSRP